MDVSLQNYIRHIPSILYACIFAILHLAPTAQYQDVLTQIIVALARSVLRSPASLLQSQELFNRDFLGGWGPWWVVRGVVPAPMDTASEEGDVEGDEGKVMDVRSAFAFAIRMLAQDEKSSSCPIPLLTSVPTEWSSYRSPTTFLRSPFQRRTFVETYQEMVSHLDENCPVVLHLHGGAHCLMSPATHRPFTTLLSYRSGSLICTPEFRLSPQHPFPAALLDCFVAYLSLISPPSNALHPPIDPARIIISGDSSGAGLAASLSLLVLTLQKHNISISLHSRNTCIPKQPHAGLSLISPWLDITRSLPSCIFNTKYDILAPPPLDAASPPFPPDSIWPTCPPRAETYCSAVMCTHPLVSPLAAKAGDWKGLGRVFVCVGWEGIGDEAEVFARRVHKAGGEVVFAGYEGMPHCFAMMPWGRKGWRANGQWARFVQEDVRDDARLGRRGWKEEPGVEKDCGIWISKKGDARKVRLSELGQGQVGCGYKRKERLTDEVVDRKMGEARRWRIGLEETMVEAWKRSR